MIKIQNLNFKRDGKEILKNISLKLTPGKITALIGENGAGKTTLLKTIDGVFPPTSGEIIWDSLKLPGNEIEFKQKSALLFENPFFYESLTGYEFIKLVSGLRKFNFTDERIQKFASLFNFKDYLDKPVSDLPKGIRQKMAITSVLFQEPDLILLDEPVNGLDPVGVKILKEVLISEKNKGKTILVSTHILEIAEKIADNIIVLHHGEVIKQGEIEKIKSENNEKVLEDLFINLTGGEKYKELLKLI
ncbi:MAG: ABC transporter ATP-binding protein [Candidatus Muiribacteriota bacterium]